MTRGILGLACALALVALSSSFAHARVECLSDVDGTRAICKDTSQPAASARVTTRHKAAKAARVVTREYGPSVIRSGKTGVTTTVAPQYRAQFQGYIDAIEAAGATIYYMGGYRRGKCSIPRHKHPCGMAIDICQDRRGHVSGARNCNLPKPAQLAAIAAAHGLLEGGVWCRSDYGHAEVRTERQAMGCGSNLYAAVERFKQHAKQ